ncbi:MAG: hypothetical protein AVDCRST_MAG64-678, partial [uncultured Phycisphaerae bacterium]
AGPGCTRGRHRREAGQPAEGVRRARVRRLTARSGEWPDRGANARVCGRPGDCSRFPPEPRSGGSTI